MRKCSCKGAFLDKFIQPSILMLLYGERLHGFSVYMKLLESEAMDYSGVDPAGVYRSLKRMEEAGLLRSAWHTDGDDSAQPRRVYEITDEGRQCLGFWAKTLKGYRDEIDRLAGAIGECIENS